MATEPMATDELRALSVSRRSTGADSKLTGRSLTGDDTIVLRSDAHGQCSLAWAVAGSTAPDEKLMRSPAMVSSECSVRISSTGTEK
jgi:hypothetical protein